MSTLLQFVIFLGLLIFVHELGHFLAAKSVGIEVEEFGFGYPPRLLKLFTWKGTDVTLNWIPFGGFVRPKGEQDPDVPGGMQAAPAWKRLFILLSGAGMNFIVGLLVLILLFSLLGVPPSSQVEIVSVAPDSPAMLAGLLPGDKVTAFNGEPIHGMRDIQERTTANLGQEITLTILRDGTMREVTLTPRLNPPEGQGAIGISFPLERMRFGEAVVEGFRTFWYQVKNTVMLPVRFIQGTLAPGEGRVVGLKGIFDLYDQASGMDQTTPVAAANGLPLYTLSFIATVSIALGIGNLLPIPALDGGQILFLLPELITGKRPSEKTQRLLATINSLFFFVLIGLMVFLLFQDFRNPILQP